MNPYYATAFLGAGWLASEAHVRYIAPREPPTGPLPAIGAACLLIIGAAALTRLVYDA